MTGTPIRTPTTDARAASDWKPNKTMAAATANSKNLEAPLRAGGSATHHADRLVHAISKTGGDINLYANRHRQQKNKNRLADHLHASQAGRRHEDKQQR